MPNSDKQPTSTIIMAEHFATLTEIYQAISASLDLDVVMYAVLDKVIEVVKAQRGFLMLVDEAGQLRVEVARGLNKEDLDTPDFQYSTTIVNQVVQTGQPLLTSNAEHDPRFALGQSIIAMSLRSIMCAPLLVKGRLIGVVYVDNSLRAGVFRDADLALLSSFAAMAGIALDNARLHQIEVRNARLERELSMAYEIQRSLLPRQVPELAGYEIAAEWRSAREVAGDFYDIFPLDGGRIGVVIADVADKGVGAALFMAVARSLIRGNAVATSSPLDTLRQANRLMMLEGGDTGMFVTVYYTIFSAGGEAVGVNAGHNCPLLYHHRERRGEWLARGGHPMGWFDEIPLKLCPLTLQAGDVLAYYTDGLTEAENGAGEPFGPDRLLEAVRQSADTGAPAEGILAYILHEVEAFVGDTPPFDDLTLVVVKYTGG